MYEKAIRLKVRFETAKGNLSVEDLWDLPLTSTRNQPNLNDIAKGINRELKSAGEEDFVNPASSGNEVLSLKFEIVKHVIAVRQQENEAARTKADAATKKARILELIAKKQDQDLEGKTLDELTALASSL